MIFPVSAETALRDIPGGAEQLHFVRPVKRKQVEAILQKCKGLERVSMSKSCMHRMPGKNLALLKNKGIRVESAKKAGRPISAPLEKMQHALEMRKDHQSLREIERVTGISKSTVHYLERYAQRSKVKNKGKVIYLK
ncbi:MAG: hypothetical protein JW744_04655 [Candidatus Diapherotrites archaeon]|uniref:Uncharacterized protein n=1 Tax=Candidatus Iainarchaeum sp. TaxID=3101447 RepID=A0A938YX32_9ARCH|nr:hypothetical protein [Candidatus Diapherotrites archaeon]